MSAPEEIYFDSDQPGLGDMDGMDGTPDDDDDMPPMMRMESGPKPKKVARKSPQKRAIAPKRSSKRKGSDHAP